MRPLLRAGALQHFPSTACVRRASSVYSVGGRLREHQVAGVAQHEHMAVRDQAAAGMKPGLDQTILPVAASTHSSGAVPNCLNPKMP